jgi:hypothetical protein
MLMNRRLLPICLIAFAALHCALATVKAGYILETADLPVTQDFTGGTVDNTQFIAARFSISQNTQVDQIGGVLRLNAPLPPGNMLLFGAIAALGPTGFPAGLPDSFTPLAVTTFTPAYSPTADTLVSLPVLLTPGDYAVIFGSGRFGATGQGFLPRVGADHPGNSFFVGEMGPPKRWENAQIVHQRLVVLGSTVPEPSALMLAMLGIGGLLIWRFSRSGAVATRCQSSQ